MKQNGKGRSGEGQRPRIPESDVRRLLETLLQGMDDPRLERYIEGLGKALSKTALLDQLRRSDNAMYDLAKALRNAASGRMEERVFAYPFTKGITTTNEGMGFGELVEVKVGKVEGNTLKMYTVTSLRTRTGKLRLDPVSPRRPDTSNGAKGEAER